MGRAAVCDWLEGHRGRGCADQLVSADIRLLQNNVTLGRKSAECHSRWVEKHRSHTPSQNNRIRHGWKICSAALPLDSARISAGLQYNTSSLNCVCLPVLFHVSVMRKRIGSVDHDSSFTGNVTLLDGSSDLKQCHEKTDAAADPGGSGTAMGRRFRR